MLDRRASRYARTFAAIATAGCALLASWAWGASSLSVGAYHSLALRSDGRVLAWGLDEVGQLGLGQSVQSSTPVPVGAIPAVAAVAPGEDHVIALTQSGTVYAWGRNASGQLGDGTRIDRAAPAPVPGIADVVALAAGRQFSLALKRDGTLWGWGSNIFGEIGLGSSRPSASTPTQVPGLARVVAVSAYWDHALALTESGEVWSWGDNDEGQLGDGTLAERDSPARVASLSNIGSIVAGWERSFAVTRDGALYAWGSNDGGALGDGTRERRTTPILIGGLGPVSRIASGYVNTYAILRDGTAWSWGSSEYGMLGDGVIGAVGAFRATPGRVAGIGNATAVVAGDLHVLFLLPGGGVVAFGWNVKGQVGDGSGVDRATPVSVASLAGIVSLGAHTDASFAVAGDGRLLAWGSNTSFQLALPRTEKNPVAQVVPGIDGVTEISAGFDYSVALRSDGTVWAWGANQYSQLGDGTLTDRPAPVRVQGLANIVAISAGSVYSLALDRDGRVWIWGGTYEPSVPGLIAGFSDVVAISCGNTHVLALKRDGTVWAAGNNDYGQLGDGTRTSRDDARAVTGLSGVVAVTAGSYRSYAVLSDGTVRGWGKALDFLDLASVLGNGATIDALSPVPIPGLDQVASVGSGKGDTSYAVRRDGTALGWGEFIYGSLGDGTTEDRERPVPIPRLRDVSTVAPSSGFAVARLSGGGILAWGSNTDGRLGDGTFALRALAVPSLGVGGTGVLDLTPENPPGIASDLLPVFGLVAAASGLDANLHIDARVFPSDADAGKSVTTFVFALAPATMVQGTVAAMDARIAVKARGAPKDAPVSCALAQLNAQGQLVAVSAASLQAYVSGVLSAQGQAVTILNGVNAANIGGATFYVGYGPNGDAMLVNGTTRSVVSVPGSVSCHPQAPQTGWWYKADEGGRGYSIEARGNKLFFAAFHYDATGNATWNFAGGATSLDGSLFTSDFLAASGGQTLTGAYRLPGLAPAGKVTFAFSDATHGTMIWPGGTVAIERQPFVPGGLTAPAQAGLPESGWWWNPAESGRGFFIEWQNGYADIAGYMYDDAGNPTWYISAYPTPDPLRFVGNWWTFAGGQAMGGPYRAATRTSDNAGSLAIEFASATTATMTLPDGRRIPLVRQAF